MSKIDRVSLKPNTKLCLSTIIIHMQQKASDNHQINQFINASCKRWIDELLEGFSLPNFGRDILRRDRRNRRDLRDHRDHGYVQSELAALVEVPE